MFNQTELDRLIKERCDRLVESLAGGDTGEIAESLLIDLYWEAAKLLGPLSDEDRDYIEDQLLEQLNGNDNPDENWSLTNLVADYTSGTISSSMFASRFALYTGSVKSTLFGVEQLREPYLLARRELGATPDHCIDCLYYATLPNQRLIDVILPGRACQCFGNCKCRIVIPGRD
jgi:hypothetical protein